MKKNTGSGSFFAAWKQFMSEVDLAAIDIEVDEVFAGARDHSAGRDACWRVSGGASRHLEQRNAGVLAG